MKKAYELTLVSVITFLFLISSASAQPQTSAGITPDSFLYGLDVAIDQIRLLLTFDTGAKARLGLQIAEERLLEVREMTLQNKLDAAQVAEREHTNSLETVKGSVKVLQRANSTQEIEDEIELEKELEEYESKVEKVQDELKIKIKVKGVLTAEQEAMIGSILNFMQNKTGEVKIEIDNKKGGTEIKIKQETGKSDEEIEDELKYIEKAKGLTEVKREKALDKIEDAREEISEVKEKFSRINVTEVNITAINVLLNQAESHLENAEAAYNETDYGKAIGQANSAEQLAKNAKKLLEKEEEERGIKVEIKESVAKVEIEIADIKMKYTLNTTNREEIVDDIIIKTGLSKEEVNSIMKLEVEGEEKESKLKIEAEIEKGSTKVKVEINETKSRFTLNTTNREDVISEVAKQTGLPVSEVKKSIKIETEEGKD